MRIVSCPGPARLGSVQLLRRRPSRRLSMGECLPPINMTTHLCVRLRRTETKTIKKSPKWAPKISQFLINKHKMLFKHMYTWMYAAPKTREGWLRGQDLGALRQSAPRMSLIAGIFMQKWAHGIKMSRHEETGWCVFVCECSEEIYIYGGSMLLKSFPFGPKNRASDTMASWIMADKSGWPPIRSLRRWRWTTLQFTRDWAHTLMEFMNICNFLSVTFERSFTFGPITCNRFSNTIMLSTHWLLRLTMK